MSNLAKTAYVFSVNFCWDFFHGDRNIISRSSISVLRVALLPMVTITILIEANLKSV